MIVLPLMLPQIRLSTKITKEHEEKKSSCIFVSLMDIFIQTL